MELRPPYLKNTECANKATEVSRAAGVSGIPVDVEMLVEAHFGIEIRPVPGLQQAAGIEGCLSADCTIIYVDEKVMEDNVGRYRFTLAHELGHFVLHRQMLEAFLPQADARIFLADHLNEEDYRRAERQANVFASHLLVPHPEVSEAFFRTEKRLHKANLYFEDLPDDAKTRVIRQIASEFDVSMKMMQIRLANEGLIEEF